MKCLLILLLCAAAAVSSMTVDLQLTPELERRVVLGHVADTFLNKGFVRENPFDLSPPELLELDARMDKLLKELHA